MINLIRDTRLHPVADLMARAISRYWATCSVPSVCALLAGTPRSGTTWLAEIMCAMPRTQMVVEPFDPNRHPQARKAGISMNYFLSPDDPAPLTLKYVQLLMEGGGLTLRHLHSRGSRPTLVDYLRTRRLVIKCVRGNRLLPWIEQTTDVPSVLAIRHPCAVVSSQIRFGGGWGTDFQRRIESGDFRTILDRGQWPHVPPEVLDDLGLTGLPPRIDTVEKFLAFEWALDLLIPQQHPSPQRHHAVYEQFVDDGPAEVDRLFDHLDRPAPDAAYQHLHVPSVTTQSKSNVARGDDPLTTWRRHLTPQQVVDVLQVVRDAGVEWYDKALRPQVDPSLNV